MVESLPLTLPFLVMTGGILLAALIVAALWLRNRRREARLEHTVAALREDLRRADEARETFFDLVSHELRSPLSAILGYQELLEDGAYGPLDDQVVEAIHRVGGSARHLLHLIDGVVELSRIRSGSVRPEPEAVDLGVVLTSVADAFRTAARDRGLDPHVHLPDTLPTLNLDQDRLVRALDLLMTSAVKNPEGAELHLHVSADEHSATVRFTHTRIDVIQETDDLALRFGIRVAVAEATARTLGGSLEFDTDQAGSIRGLAFHLRTMASSPAHDL